MNLDELILAFSPPLIFVECQLKICFKNSTRGSDSNRFLYELSRVMINLSISSHRIIKISSTSHRNLVEDIKLRSLLGTDMFHKS